MLHTPRKAIATTLIAPPDADGQALADAMAADARFAIKTRFSSLAEAYSATEESPPDLLVCAQSVTNEAEFAMFEALASMLGIRLVSGSGASGAEVVAAALGLQARTPTKAPLNGAPTREDENQKLIVIGSSTGGIEALRQILKCFPVNCPPTVIVQHIKPDFLDGVVARLDSICPAHVTTAEGGLKLRSGLIVFAPGSDQHLEIEPRSLTCRLRAGLPVSGHRPSIDHLMQSVAPLGAKAIGVILTGMGRDGATGLAKMRASGAWTVAQDAESSTVYGMPRVAREEGAACAVLSLENIPQAILKAARRPAGALA